MSGERFVDVNYRGLELGRRLKVSEFGPTTAYLEHATPMPVGAPLEIVTDEGVRFAAQVVRIHEQVGGAERHPGMRIEVRELEAAAREWWSTKVSGPDRDSPATDSVREAAAAAAAPASASAADGEPTDVVATVPDLGDAVPLNGSNGNGEDGEDASGGRRTSVMSVVEIQAIVDQASGGTPGGPSNGHSSGPVEQDITGDGEEGDPSASGSHAIPARGKSAKKKRRRK